MEETMVKTKWAIDPTHSEVQFKVKHLVISTVTGTFKSFEGLIEGDGEEFNEAKASFKLDVDSIDTNVSDRDAHLKSDDFFNAEKYPQITFDGVLHKEGENTFRMPGTITIRDVSKEIEFEVEHGGSMVDPYGQHKAGFEISGVINRKDFGLNWSMVTEAGGVVVGDEVKILLNVQVINA